MLSPVQQRADNAEVGSSLQKLASPTDRTDGDAPSILSMAALAPEDQQQNVKDLTGFPSHEALMAFVQLLNADGACTKLAHQAANRASGHHCAPAPLHQVAAAAGAEPAADLGLADQLLLVLVVLRTGMRTAAAAERFGIPHAAAARHFAAWLPYMHRFLRRYLRPPRPSEVAAAAAASGGSGGGSGSAPVIAALGFLHVRVAAPASDAERAEAEDLWQPEARRHALRFLLALSPAAGALCYVSGAFGAAAARVEIVRASDFSPLLAEAGYARGSGRVLLCGGGGDALSRLNLELSAAAGLSAEAAEAAGARAARNLASMAVPVCAVLTNMLNPPFAGGAVSECP
ncbi:hypothetical protein JKP88DRAFT_326822 [Tribonema minus]|uniref:Transposase Helix-turn-helix domain-containing protein n=1 Tax=Tribonema minus TaxID=303371 RepID=A0A835YYB3_9STRA|nr:hypothetical protein JKP88DRAFT_326822 [Tribonema minus]